MRAYLQQAYGARDQLAYGSGTTIPHVAPLMRATLATGTQRDYPESRAVHDAGFRVCAQEGASGMTRNHRSRKCECIPIPAPRTSLILLVSCPVRGASRGDPEVGQSESWPEGQPEGRCGARGCVSQTQTRGALGNRPCPIRGAAFSGWTGQAKGGRKPAWMASLLAPAPGRTGPRDEEVAAMERPKGAFLLPRRVVRRSISPQKGEIN
jgi:hypothetical protein